jgi:hypothetical protein
MPEEYGLLTEEALSVLDSDREWEIARLREEWGEVYEGKWWMDEE